MEPLFLKAPCKDYLWGGTRLKTEFGKVSDLPKVAESWELSCHKDGKSVIENGPFSGKTLSEFLQDYPQAVGKQGKKFPYFPVLIKLIDAKEKLSVQVHPSNEYAMRVEGEYGKTEMWYVVDCKPNAQLLYGFRREISKEEFKRRIADHTLLEVTNAVPVKPGDVFFIESGTLHAIGEGILIAEIQQNSNTTYRVYDYGRIGTDGKPRQLHVEKAVDVTCLKPAARKPGAQGKTESIPGGEKTLLASCDYFTVYHFLIEQETEFFVSDESFQSLLCLNGEGKLCYQGKEDSLKKGQTVFLPSEFGSYTVKGPCEFLLTQL